MSKDYEEEQLLHEIKQAFNAMRYEYHLTIVDVAEQCGCSESAIRKVLNDIMPTDAALERLTEIIEKTFELTPEQFVEQGKNLYQPTVDDLKSLAKERQHEQMEGNRKLPKKLRYNQLYQEDDSEIPAFPDTNDLALAGKRTFESGDGQIHFSSDIREILTHQHMSIEDELEKQPYLRDPLVEKKPVSRENLKAQSFRFSLSKKYRDHTHERDNDERGR